MQYISQLSSSTFLWNCALCLPSQQLNWCQKSCRRQRIFQLVKADASTTWQALAGRQLFKRQTARVSITYLLASTKHCNVFTKTWDLNLPEMLSSMEDSSLWENNITNTNLDFKPNSCQWQQEAKSLVVGPTRSWITNSDWTFENFKEIKEIEDYSVTISFTFRVCRNTFSRDGFL